jgi:hypothetical protein
MNGPDRLVGVGDALAQVTDERSVQLRHCVTHGVRNVERCGPLGDCRFKNAAQEIRLGAITIFRRELDVARELAREADRESRLLVDLLRRHAQLLLHVQGARRDEEVDAGRMASLQCLGGARDVAIIGPSEGTHDTVFDGVRYRLDAVEVTVRRCSEAGFDHVHAQPLELARDAQLLILGHGRAGRLLAVTQRRVEDDQLVSHGGSPWWRLVVSRPAAGKTKRPVARCRRAVMTERRRDRSASPENS